MMLWLGRIKLVVVISAILILVTGGLAVHGHQQPTKEEAGEQAQKASHASPSPAGAEPDLVANRAIAREQLALIDKAWDLQRRLARGSRVELNDASFAEWGRRRLATLRRAGARKPEIVTALEKYINDLKEDEIEAKDRLAHASGTQLAVYDVQFRRMEAEMWLNEEKAR